MRSHSAQTFVAFLTDVVGMEVQFELHVPGEVLEKTLGWPPSDGADVTMVGTGEAGLIEVLDVPERLRDVAPEGLAALSFMTDDFGGRDGEGERVHERCHDVRHRFSRVPNCSSARWAGVPMEFMGAYAPEANSGTSDATNS